MKTNILVIGSGIAGLTVALKASRFAQVILATKDQVTESNTKYAQGGLAGVFGKDDEIKLHVQDTIRAGDGLTNRKTAKILAESAPHVIKELDNYGVKFSRLKGTYRLSREAVHSRARIVHASDTTGEKIEKILVEKIKKERKIALKEFCIAIDLIMRDNKCVGGNFLDINNNKIIQIFASHIILATGGLGQLYSITTNPEIATGDGIAIAYRAGAALEDMEFIQFHPTMLHNSSPGFLISETLRGEGGLLKNNQGKSYMKSYHRDGELAPRDVVARFSVIEMKKKRSKHVFLDVSHIEAQYLKKRFPHIYQRCLQYGYDLTKEMIPVSPAAHYTCGGIKTNSYGQTTIKNLYAVGECACTQLHGADRLASNSLTEGMVFGTRLVTQLKKSKEVKIIEKDYKANIIGSENGRVRKMRKSLQQIMWQYVGIIRNRKGLLHAKEKIQKLKRKYKKIPLQSNKEHIEFKNMLLLSELIIKAALRRKESRGTHFMEDYPERTDSIWQQHLVLQNK